jgi:hypothetical protein
MRFTRWTNPMLPQTLHTATLLFYISAVFGVLFGTAFSLLGLIIVVADTLSGLGIANSYKWGYKLAVAAAALGLLPYVLLLASDGLGQLFSLPVLIGLVFPVALFALVVHPMSREHQRIWFE